MIEQLPSNLVVAGDFFSNRNIDSVRVVRDRPARFRFTVSKLLSGPFVAERVLLPIRSENSSSMLGQLASSPEITVSHPGKAKIFVRESAARPASVAPARTKTKELKRRPL